MVAIRKTHSLIDWLFSAINKAKMNKFNYNRISLYIQGLLLHLLLVRTDSYIQGCHHKLLIFIKLIDIEINC